MARNLTLLHSTCITCKAWFQTWVFEFSGVFSTLGISQPSSSSTFVLLNPRAERGTWVSRQESRFKTDKQYMQLTNEHFTGSVAKLKITSRQERGTASLAFCSPDVSSPSPDTKGSKQNTVKLDLKSFMSLSAHQSLLI